MGGGERLLVPGPEWFEESPLVVAPLLLGGTLTSRAGGETVAVRITEVEAYDGEDDPASHARAGKTRRNASMFGPVGRAYVYYVYGMHWSVNVVAHQPGRAGGVLLRCGEIVEGLQVAAERSGREGKRESLACGPARLAKSLGITGDLDGTGLSGPDLVLHVREEALGAYETGPRVGVSAGAEEEWRYWVPEGPVSPYRAGGKRRRSPASSAAGERR